MSDRVLSDRGRRAAHLVTGLVAGGAVVLQFVLVWQGSAVLDEVDPPGRAERVERFFSYFTILSNLLVAVVSLRDGLARTALSPVWRVLRLNAVVGITVTAVVHWFLLRPLLDLTGADRLADTLLHVVVPALAVLTWLVAGPRGQVARADLAASAAFPGLYMAWTLVHGAWRGWYPYPFVDVDELGYARVIGNGIAVVALLVALSLAVLALDRRLTPGTTKPRAEGPGASL